MNLQKAFGRVQRLAFRASRTMLGLIHGGRISAFGTGTSKIGMVLIVNLDRQPQRLRRTLRELSRFRTSDGRSLASLARRLAAVDARDGRAVAATADVDQTYLLRDQLYVQPDARLEECFGVEEPIRMTRQEVAVARSHIEAWKTIVAGPCDNVLVLEDDVWFRRGAAAAIDRGWRAAARRCAGERGPRLLYLSYEDAGGTAARVDICDALFRPKRGLWFLSGYILSREGAEVLLRSMPVIGPVDMWINYRFDELGALALSSPAILQRLDGGSDNCYSVLPYLARAGIVDADAVQMPRRAAVGPILGWTARNDREGLAMALSMLGLRVRAFDGDEDPIRENELPALLEKFDALVDVPLSAGAISAAIGRTSASFVFEAGAYLGRGIELDRLPSARTVVLHYESGDASWQQLCALLGLALPIQAFPIGPLRQWRVFRDDRAALPCRENSAAPWFGRMDDSPWILLPESGWPPGAPMGRAVQSYGTRIFRATMTTPTPELPRRVETFPGNLAAFSREGLVHDTRGAHLVLSKMSIGDRPYRSGAFASARTFGHGRFEAEIRAARGSGLVTGFFLHRDLPRQEIDVELTGNDPYGMLVNVYFNPGDDGAAIGFGYRGSPCRIELGFDTSLDFHLYAIDWRPGCISWCVDGRVVHERVGWDPTPIPHLPMRLHANLWVPRSEELAGRIDESALPSTATFRNVSIWT
ncbi:MULTISPECIES: family 16 glycosylhydrolase [unclassified Mesorhizobium]|uniref:family 16 glycosylhydrolase n=1 Tax=unclassified Mesorhizobium TaxID=325217 RepID=UPI00333AB04C